MITTTEFLASFPSHRSQNTRIYTLGVCPIGSTVRYVNTDGVPQETTAIVIGDGQERPRPQIAGTDKSLRWVRVLQDGQEIDRHPHCYVEIISLA